MTREGVGFLAGGAQEPLKYATGALRPAESSVHAFADNIVGRRHHARAHGAEYAHVLFPDKQSVLSDVFPLSPLVRLGDTYVERMAPAVRNSVIYPVELLQIHPDAYLPLDTHLSNAGSLVVLREMLDNVSVEAPAALERISARISRPRRWEGDLGIKLNPPRFQQALMLDPDWRFTQLSSQGGFNDGMVDILTSPDAPVDRTVLLFGDSFFRLMLRHLTGVFTRVICLRTRFYHREMVELIEPDIVFTGNAERYLSRVDPDDEASPFMLYNALRGVNEPFEPAFLKAWRAITAPRSSHAHRFWNEHATSS